MGTKLLYIIFISILFLGCNSKINRIISYSQLSPCNEILDSLDKENNKYFIEFHCKECKKWNPPNEEQLLDIFKKMDTLLNKYEKNDYYSNIHNCGVEGEVLLEHIKYDYYVNAGGWVSLKNEKLLKEIYLGCNSEDCREYFLSIRLTELEREGEEN